MKETTNLTLKPVLEKERVIHFLWQHLLLLVSLFIMTFGVAVCVRSNFGSSVISSNPLVMTLAGEIGKMPALSIGEYTNLMNVILVFGQFLILRRKFELIQLFQLIIGFFFGFLLDINMYLTSWMSCESLWSQIAAQVGGCVVLGTGIAFEVKCGSITMPGEGFPAALCKAFGMKFPKAKICVDVSLVVIAVLFCYLFFGRWLWNVAGPGTLFAMFFVGMVVKFYHGRMGWFDRILGYRPGFRRYIYGLQKYLMQHQDGAGD